VTASRRWLRHETTSHAGIYLLIAGSYTALISVGCRGHVPIAIIVALEWLLAGGGCLFSAAGVGMSKTETNWLELATFGVMGFACLPCIGLIKELLGPEALFLVGLGGAFYVIGVIPFILADKHPGWHVVWHLFVMAGAVTHWFCVYLYVVPSADGAKTFDRDDLREIVSGLKSDVYNTTGSLEVALLSHALSMNTSTAAALVDEYRRAMSSFLADHTPRPSLPRYFRKRWDRLTQRLEGVEAVAPAVEEVVEVAKKKGRLW
jgi:channel protein (hemolysin III family)